MCCKSQRCQEKYDNRSSLLSAVGCLFVMLNGQWKTCLLQSSSSTGPTVHCYVQCDVCCYFPPLKRFNKAFLSALQMGRWPQTSTTSLREQTVNIPW